MEFKNQFRKTRWLGAVLLAASATSALALSEAQVTPAISGVVAGGVQIRLVKDGFNGTEGPITLPDGSLIFTENQANRVIKIGTDDSVSTFLGNTNGVNAIGFSGNGDLYAVQTLKPRVGIVYPDDHAKTLAENFEGASFGRPNDIVVDRKGGVYFTDSGAIPKPDQTQPPSNVAKPAVYYITPEGKLNRIADDIERPNGIQLSPDEKVLYVANTWGEYVLAYDVAADGSIGARRNFAKLEGWKKTETGGNSGADGLVIDAQGRVYVATTIGIQVFDSKGQPLGTIPLPKQPQNLAFAGPGKKTLYVVGRGAVYKIATLTSGVSTRAK